jgi:hypothetical protein
MRRQIQRWFYRWRRWRMTPAEREADDQRRRDLMAWLPAILPNHVYVHDTAALVARLDRRDGAGDTVRIPTIGSIDLGSVSGYGNPAADHFPRKGAE